LNLGHTFGHAIENAMGYGQWLHGEAVAAGTLVAAELSKRKGLIKETELVRIQKLFQLLDNNGNPYLNTGIVLMDNNYSNEGPGPYVSLGNIRNVFPASVAFYCKVFPAHMAIWVNNCCF